MHRTAAAHTCSLPLQINWERNPADSCSCRAWCGSKLAACMGRISDLCCNNVIIGMHITSWPQTSLHCQCQVSSGSNQLQVRPWSHGTGQCNQKAYIIEMPHKNFKCYTQHTHVSMVLSAHSPHKGPHTLSLCKIAKKGITLKWFGGYGVLTCLRTSTRHWSIYDAPSNLLNVLFSHVWRDKVSILHNLPCKP